jgi:hypothetical protein
MPCPCPAVRQHCSAPSAHDGMQAAYIIKITRIAESSNDPQKHNKAEDVVEWSD